MNCGVGGCTNDKSRWKIDREREMCAVVHNGGMDTLLKVGLNDGTSDAERLPWE